MEFLQEPEEQSGELLGLTLVPSKYVIDRSWDDEILTKYGLFFIISQAFHQQWSNGTGCSKRGCSFHS